MDVITYRYMDREFTRDELRREIEDKAAGLDPDQWMFGEFEFPEWLSDAVITGHVEKVFADHD